MMTLRTEANPSSVGSSVKTSPVLRNARVESPIRTGTADSLSPAKQWAVRAVVVASK